MMRKILTTMLAVVMFAITAGAQNGDSPEKPTPAQITEKMAENLNLTADQKAQVLDLNTEYEDVIFMHGHGGPGFGPGPGQRPGGQPPANMPPQRPEFSEEQKAQFEAMKTKREQYTAKLKSIISEEQFAKYENTFRRGPKPDKQKKKKK